MISRTLLCLLSDQRMQNVLPLYQRGQHFDRVIMLASRDETGRVNPRFESIAQELRLALGDRAELALHPQAVDPMDPASTEAACRALVRANGGPECVTINFTGGLKPMSIGAYQAGLAEGAPMIYVDTQAEQMVHYQGGRLRIEAFNLAKIGVETVLLAHGRPVNQRGTASLRKPEFEIMAEKLFVDVPASLPALLKFQEFIKSTQLSPEGEVVLQVHHEKSMPTLFNDMLAFGMARASGNLFYLNTTAVAFINGGWLESFVYLCLQQAGGFMDVACRLKVAGIDNELDVACTLNGKLGVIECKSGSLKGPVGQSALNRLRALKETLGGTFGRSFLIVASLEENLSADFIRRANEYVSRVIYLNELEQTPAIIRQYLSSRRR